MVEAWNEVAPSTMSSAWKKLWPECVHDFVGFGNEDVQVTALAQEAGFKEVNEENVGELLTSHREDLSNEDLIELEQQRTAEADDTSDTDT